MHIHRVRVVAACTCDSVMMYEQSIDRLRLPLAGLAFLHDACRWMQHAEGMNSSQMLACCHHYRKQQSPCTK